MAYWKRIDIAIYLYGVLLVNKGRDTLTPLPFVVMKDMFWHRRSASYFVNVRS